MPEIARCPGAYVDQGVRLEPLAVVTMDTRGNSLRIGCPYLIQNIRCGVLTDGNKPCPYISSALVSAEQVPDRSSRRAKGIVANAAPVAVPLMERLPIVRESDSSLVQDESSRLLGALVRIARQTGHQPMNQNMLAAQVGMSPTTINMIEAMASKEDVTTALKRTGGKSHTILGPYVGKSPDGITELAKRICLRRGELQQSLGFGLVTHAVTIPRSSRANQEKFGMTVFVTIPDARERGLLGEDSISLKLDSSGMVVELTGISAGSLAMPEEKRQQIFELATLRWQVALDVINSRVSATEP